MTKSTPTSSFQDRSYFLLALIAMALVVLVSNILVQHPFTPLGLADFLTWAAFTYPVAFLINDLTNRYYGPKAARKVVFLGFALAVILSLIFADMRIAIASGTAFFTAHMLDVFVFDKLRDKLTWWHAPLLSSLLGSSIDTLIFFPLAFYGAGDSFINMVQSYSILGISLTMETWVMWAFCDYMVKLGVAVVMLGAYRLFLKNMLQKPAF